MSDTEVDAAAAAIRLLGNESLVGDYATHVARVALAAAKRVGTNTSKAPPMHSPDGTHWHMHERETCPFCPHPQNAQIETGDDLLRKQLEKLQRQQDEIAAAFKALMIQHPSEIELAKAIFKAAPHIGQWPSRDAARAVIALIRKPPANEQPATDETDDPGYMQLATHCLPDNPEQRADLARAIGGAVAAWFQTRG